MIASSFDTICPKIGHHLQLLLANLLLPSQGSNEKTPIILKRKHTILTS
jgi:hypothetical protein